MNAPLREISDLPAPRGLPILGNALQVEPTRLHAICEEWRRQLGDYYRFSIGKRRFLVVGDAETIAQTLRDRPDGFQRTERLNKSARAMGFGGVFSANGEQWKRQRPMVMAGFDPAHIRKYFPTLVKVTERFLRRWQRAASSGGTAGTPIDLTADLMRYTVDVTAGLAFGADINTIESDEDVIQRHLDKVLPALYRRVLSPFPWLPVLPTPANLRLRRLGDFPSYLGDVGGDAADHLALEIFHDFGTALILPHGGTGDLLAVLQCEYVGQVWVGIRRGLLVVGVVGSALVAARPGPQGLDAELLHHVLVVVGRSPILGVDDALRVQGSQEGDGRKRASQSRRVHHALHEITFSSTCQQTQGRRLQTRSRTPSEPRP